MGLQNPLLPVKDTSTNTMPATAADYLTSADIQRLRHSLDSSVSDNTRKMYASAWRSFQTWAHGRGNLSLPASPQLVAAYLAHLAEERNLSVATIRLHKAALAAVRATANNTGAPWEPARSRNRPSEPPGEAGWTWLCSPFYGTACSDAQRPIYSHGQT